jgi:hypothetical protein
VQRLLAAVSDVYRYPTRLIVHLLYACGLRVCEPLNLRIKDVDLRSSKLYVYRSKGGKGRVVQFPSCLTQPLQEQLNAATTGGMSIKGVGRQVTLDLIKRTEVSGIDWVTIPAAQDDTTERPYWTEGDILIVSPFAGAVAKIEDVDESVREPDHYMVSYAFRWSHKYVRWATKYLRRVIIVKKHATDVPWGSVTVDAFDTRGMSLYFDRPVLKSSVSNTELKLEESTDGGSNWVEVPTPIAVGGTEVKYDLRHVRITWATGAVDAGKMYRVSNQSGEYFADIFGDVAYHRFTALVAASNIFSV